MLKYLNPLIVRLLKGDTMKNRKDAYAEFSLQFNALTQAVKTNDSSKEEEALTKLIQALLAAKEAVTEKKPSVWN
jgi:hypothetical protein